MSGRTSGGLIQIGGVREAQRQPGPQDSPERLARVFREQHGAKSGIRLALKFAKHAADQHDPQQQQFWLSVADVLGNGPT